MRRKRKNSLNSDTMKLVDTRRVVYVAAYVPEARFLFLSPEPVPTHHHPLMRNYFID